MFNKMTIALITAMFLLSCSGNRPDKTTDANQIRKTKSAGKAIDMEDGELYLLIGTYTSDEGSKGIYVHKFNTLTGESDSVSMVEVSNPSYLTLSTDESLVYAVGEGGNKNSAVYSFEFDKESGVLSQLNTQPTESNGPCYITIDEKGKNVHTANYGGGSISSFKIANDGSLMPVNSVLLFEGSGPVKGRQGSPHLHSIDYSVDGRFLFAADLGSDKLYRFNANDTPFEGQPSIQRSSLKEFILPEGTGPRHFAFHPNGGKYLYLLGELSGEVLVFDYNYGDLIQKQIIAADTTGAQGSADIHVSPDGRFLYASNRLENDGIAIFSISEEDGTLTKVGYQLTAKHPRNFVISPNGKYLLVAGRDDDKIEVFEVDNETGMLANTNRDILISKPVCLKFAGR